VTTLRVEDAKRQRLTLADDLKFTKTPAATESHEEGKILKYPDGLNYTPLHQP
jgi:hypothetical protein